MHAAATAAAASAQAAQAAAAAAAHAARGPSALLPSVHRAKLQANAENLLRAMRPQVRVCSNGRIKGNGFVM